MKNKFNERENRYKIAIESHERYLRLIIEYRQTGFNSSVSICPIIYVARDSLHFIIKFIERATVPGALLLYYLYNLNLLSSITNTYWHNPRSSSHFVLHNVVLANQALQLSPNCPAHRDNSYETENIWLEQRWRWNKKKMLRPKSETFFFLFALLRRRWIQCCVIRFFARWQTITTPSQQTDFSCFTWVVCVHLCMCVSSGVHKREKDEKERKKQIKMNMMCR